MISVGGGVGLVLLAIAAAFFAENPWLRLVARVCVGLYFGWIVWAAIFSDSPPQTFLMPLLMLCFALYVMEVHSTFEKW